MTTPKAADASQASSPTDYSTSNLARDVKDGERVQAPNPVPPRGSRDEEETSGEGEEAWEEENRIFYLRKEKRYPPCHVTFVSTMSRRRRVTTMGGALWDGETTFGLIAGRHLPNKPEYIDTQTAQDTSEQNDPTTSRKAKQVGIKAIIDPTQGKSVSSYDSAVQESCVGHVMFKDETARPSHWALVPIETPVPIENIVFIPGGFGESFVVTETEKTMPTSLLWIVTGSGEIIQGWRYLSKRSLREGAHEIAGQWRIRTSEGLNSEDCGSWVIDSTTRKWLGVIFEVKQGISWVIPANVILQEIQDQGGPSLKLYSHESVASTSLGPKQSSGEKGSGEKSVPSLPRLPSTEHSLDYMICCFRVRKYSKANAFSSKWLPSPPPFERSVGRKFGTVDGDTLWKLQGPYEYYWQELRPQIEDIVRRTPTKSENETSPVVRLHGFMAGTEMADALPTVAITCSSATYANQLKKAVLRSGLLDRYNFQSRILNRPIRKDGPEDA